MLNRRTPLCHTRPEETQNAPVSPLFDLKPSGPGSFALPFSKREDLINQIKDQHSQIKELMAQLESSGARSRRRPSSPESSDDIASSIQSPSLSPSSPSDSHSPTDSEEGDKAIETWIAKAKQSLQEFDVFISAGMPQSYVIEDKSWEDDSDDDDYVNINGSGDEYAIAVENADGGEVVEVVGGNLKHKLSASSISTSGTGVLVRNRKHAIRSAKPVILPSEAVPFGLFGQLSLQSPESNAEAEDDGVKGIAGKNFFTSSQLYFRFPFRSLSMNLSFLQPLLGASTSNWAVSDMHPKSLPAKLSPPKRLTSCSKCEWYGTLNSFRSEVLYRYYDNMNLSLSLLDPELYTPQKTFYRSPFLFTVSESRLINLLLSCAVLTAFKSAQFHQDFTPSAQISILN